MGLVLGLGSQELIIFVVPVVSIALCLWALFDALSRPEIQWTAAGQSRGLWLIVLTVSLLLSCAWMGWLGVVAYAYVPRRAMLRLASRPGV